MVGFSYSGTTFREMPDGMWECDHIISSSEYPTDKVEATSGLFDATYNLVTLFKQHQNKIWKFAIFQIWKENTSWKSKIKFSYLFSDITSFRKDESLLCEFLVSRWKVVSG